MLGPWRQAVCTYTTWTVPMRLLHVKGLWGPYDVMLGTESGVAPPYPLPWYLSSNSTSRLTSDVGFPTAVPKPLSSPRTHGRKWNGFLKTKKNACGYMGPYTPHVLWWVVTSGKSFQRFYSAFPGWLMAVSELSSTVVWKPWSMLISRNGQDDMSAREAETEV